MNDALQRIAVAVTPAVMLSACGLLALGLDNQVSRLSARLRELVREHRALGGATPRRELVRRQVTLFSRRHALVARALVLDYLALFAFIVTSFLSLVGGPLPLPASVPIIVFGVGVLMLLLMAVFVIRSTLLAREALELEAREVAGQLAEPPPRERLD